jgi:hypothetical protein
MYGIYTNIHPRLIIRSGNPPPRRRCCATVGVAPTLRRKSYPGPGCHPRLNKGTLPFEKKNLTHASATASSSAPRGTHNRGQPRRAGEHRPRPCRLPGRVPGRGRPRPRPLRTGASAPRRGGSETALHPHGAEVGRGQNGQGHQAPMNTSPYAKSPRSSAGGLPKLNHRPTHRLVKGGQRQPR